MLKPAVKTYTDHQRTMSAPSFFWTSGDHITGDAVTLFGAEARHAVTVCRLHKGELMTVTDGAGNAYDCEVTSASSKDVVGRIIRPHRMLGEPLAHVTLAAGIGRPQVYDWIVEKAVELGVSRIIPLRCAESPSGIGGEQAGERRVERWRRLALGAMKQSLRSVLPMVDPITTPESLAAIMEDFEHVWIADPQGKRLSDALRKNTRSTTAIVIVGPEGGLTSAERDLFILRGAQSISLGSRRLRAETASIAALTLVMQHLGEL